MSEHTAELPSFPDPAQLKRTAENIVKQLSMFAVKIEVTISAVAVYTCIVAIAMQIYAIILF